MIVPSKDADLVREAFQGICNRCLWHGGLRKKLVDKGLKCERTRFPDLLRNKAYIGKVLVPAYKDEPEYYAKGIHEPLITEELFFQIEEILEGRSPNRPTKNTLKE